MGVLRIRIIHFSSFYMVAHHSTSAIFVRMYKSHFPPYKCYKVTPLRGYIYGGGGGVLLVCKIYAKIGGAIGAT